MSRRVACVVVAVILSLSCLAVAQELQNLLAQADSLYDPQNGEFDLVAYEARLRGSIALYEQALPLIPADDVTAKLATLHRLARAWFELGKAYLPKGADQQAAFESGKDHALASLRLGADFVARETTSFRDALSNANDIEGVFWYGNNLGLYINYDPVGAILGGMSDVRACYERAIALDETFLAAAPLRSLASFLAQVPSFLGGDTKRARELFERAIALAPEFLENSTALAANILKPAKDEALCPTLAWVRESANDPTVMSAWPLYNTLAARDAEVLLVDGKCR